MTTLKEAVYSIIQDLRQLHDSQDDILALKQVAFMLTVTVTLILSFGIILIMFPSPLTFVVISIIGFGCSCLLFEILSRWSK